MLFDAAAPGETALVLSPADNFLDSMIGFNRQYDVLQLGLQGKIATVPAGANTSFLLSPSGRGINAAMQKLGVTLRTLHNTTRPVRKTPLFAPLIFKNDHFTRQARDKHRENSKKERFLTRRSAHSKALSRPRRCHVRLLALC